MPTTTLQKWEKPLSREQHLELFLQVKLDEIDAALGNEHITGLPLIYGGTNSVWVGSGAAWVNGYGRMRVTSLLVSGASIGASQWGHVYLYSNTGVPTIEVTTTGPTFYQGIAAQKSTDATRRYLGSVKTNASGNLHRWIQIGNEMHWLDDTLSAPFRLVANGLATTRTTVSASAVAPTTARGLLLRAGNSSTAANLHFGNSEDGTGGSTGAAVKLTGGGSTANFTMPLDGFQAFQYWYGGAPGSFGAYIDACGYILQR